MDNEVRVLSNKNFEKEYNELLRKYEKLNKDYRFLNNQLYYIKSSRLYKLSELIRKIIRPFRSRLSKIIRALSLKNYKLKKFLKNSDKVVIIPSSFEFDEIVNQRPINYAKFLAKNGYKVMFVVWQWDKYTVVNNSFKNVSKNIFQIPLYDFLKKTVDYSHISDKTFLITFPHELFYEVIKDYRLDGFRIHYDNMDEWEEFQKVGQADWYKKSYEEKIILESDLVSAVSPALIDKFSYLRSDILLTPNGYYTHITGEHNKDISLTMIKDDKINIGYFGHLTNSWFDWELILEVAKKQNNFVFHLIGYGAPEEILKKIEEIHNIKYYGKIPTHLLGDYVKNWNIGIIPFRESKLSKAVDPIKIYEYLYMGLDVIATGIEHLKTYPKTSVVNNSKEFIDTVNKIINDDKSIDINNFLENAKWERRFDTFIKEYDRKTIMRLYEK